MYLVFLDCLIYNFTAYKSFFFLNSINSKSLVYNLAVGIFIDYFLIHLYFPTTIYIVGVYFLRKYLHINFLNVFNYYLFNIVVVLVYYLVLALFNNFDLSIIFNILVINSIFILICYIKDTKNINLFR
mgnify:CR=1 FL=1